MLKRRELLTVVGAIFILAEICLSQTWEVDVLMDKIVGAWNLPGDFDNDGDVDLLIQDGDTLFLYENMMLSLNNDGPHRDGFQLYSAGSNVNWAQHVIDDQFYNSEFCAINITDMDGDGDLDVLQAAMNAPGGLYWSENKNAGQSWERHTIRSSSRQMGNMPNAVGDIDGDGDMDFTFIYMNDGKTVWFENAADTAWIEHDVGALGDGIWATLADLDGDSDLDVIAARYQAGTIVLFENQLPDSAWNVSTITTLPGTAIGECVDMDMDGDLDVVTHSNAPGKEALKWFENPSWESHRITSNVPGLNYGAVGDIDKDGDLDVAFGGVHHLGWCENLNNALEWKRHTIHTITDKYPLPTAVVDIDLDSYPDITAYTIDFSKRPARGDALLYTNPEIMPTAVEIAKRVLPKGILLAQNYPNPFNPTTNIEFSLPSSQFVMLKVYDLNGREIAALVNEQMPAGLHNVHFDGSSLTSGLYVYRLAAGDDIVESRKMMLVK